MIINYTGYLYEHGEAAVLKSMDDLFLDARPKLVQALDYFKANGYQKDQKIQPSNGMHMIAYTTKENWLSFSCEGISFEDDYREFLILFENYAGLDDIVFYVKSKSDELPLDKRHFSKDASLNGDYYRFYRMNVLNEETSGFFESKALFPYYKEWESFLIMLEGMFEDFDILS